jgi:RNA polymerase primary sigma factor
MEKTARKKRGGGEWFNAPCWEMRLNDDERAMVEANMAWAIKCVNKLRRSNLLIGRLPLGDAISYAAMAVCRAVKTLDATRGQITTYIFRIVRQTLGLAACCFVASVKLPAHIFFSSKTGRTNHYTEKSECIGKAMAAYSPCQAKVNFDKMHDAASDPDDDDGVGAFEFLRHLPSRERYVIERNFIGEQTYDQIAETLGVTKERVRQLRERALRRMRTFMVGDPRFARFSAA